MSATKELPLVALLYNVFDVIAFVLVCFGLRFVGRGLVACRRRRVRLWQCRLRFGRGLYSCFSFEGGSGPCWLLESAAYDTALH